MQHFHRDRMACVNKSIRELWRLIYRGNDIDFIEIKTDEACNNNNIHCYFLIEFTFIYFFKKF